MWYLSAFICVHQCTPTILQHTWTLRSTTWSSCYENSQWYGFSLVWVLMWFLKLLVPAKPFLQYTHWNGFSFLWVLMRYLRSFICVHQCTPTILQHTWSLRLTTWCSCYDKSQWYGFSLVWVLMWFFKLLVCKTFSAILTLKWFLFGMSYVIFKAA